MKFYIKAAALIMLTVSLTFSACGGGGDPGGDPETPASTLFANKSYLAPGAICPNGGIQIDMGFDNNKNNVLDADEITKTEYVCNGEDGDDASSHPFVVYTNPTPNETDVELDTVISAVFNTEMDATTITDQTFTVKDSGGNSVAGTVSYSGIVAVFTPAEPLSINKKYTVNLVSTIENHNDIAMGYNHKTYFTGGKAAVIYKANGAEGGTVPVNTNRYNTGETVSVSSNTGSLVKNECIFDGWNTRADGLGTSYASGSTVTIGATSVILYAKWKTTYIVTYNGNGADGGDVPTDNSRYYEGQGVTTFSNTGSLYKTGCIFSGWNTASDGTGTGYAVNTIFSMGPGNVTLYAMWTSVYTVTYDGNGGSGIVPTDSNLYTSGLDVTVKANINLVKSGLHFAGWSTVQDGGTTYAPGAVFSMGNANVTLYAKWVYDPFLDAANPGDAVTVTAGTAAFDMIYVNNAASVTFPTGISDSATYAMTTKFFMGETEVTYELWKTVYDWATDSARTNRYYFARAGVKGSDGDAGKSTQHPVTAINWRDAIVWCNALTEYYNDINGTSILCVYTYSSAVIRDSRDANAAACDGAVASASAKGFRLPTSMEWEFAARYRGTDATNAVTATVSGTNFSTMTTKWTKGNFASGAATYYNNATGTSPNFAGKLANDKVAVYRYFYNGSTWIDYLVYLNKSRSSTEAVMSKGAAGANTLGLYDMSGNLWEWCFDLISPCRVIRGGCFDSYASYLQVGFWYYESPYLGGSMIGFRIAKTQ